MADEWKGKWPRFVPDPVNPEPFCRGCGWWSNNRDVTECRYCNGPMTPMMQAEADELCPNGMQGATERKQ